MVRLDSIESIRVSKMFPKGKLRIFDYIVENGPCTKDEIELAIYGRHFNHLHSNVLSVHMSQIGKQLERWTMFRLKSNATKPISKQRGKPSYLYKIIAVKPSVGEEATVVAKHKPRGVSDVTA